jgi:hypothetical protein
MTLLRRVTDPESPATPIRALYRAMNERDYEAGVRASR